MGKRGFGALEFRPARGPQPRTSTAVDLARLVVTARQALHGEFDGDAHAGAALKQLIQVGTSAGGARAKAAIAWNPATQEMRSGLFETEPGFEHWLLKFDGIGPDSELGSPPGYGRIEYAYALMARAAGIRMAECRLLEENGRAHFMTRRFDRDGNSKLHLQVVQELRLGQEALEEAFRRVAFNVMAKSCDDHTKNFSFLHAEAGSWSLAGPCPAGGTPREGVATHRC